MAHCIGGTVSKIDSKHVGRYSERAQPHTKKLPQSLRTRHAHSALRLYTGQDGFSTTERFVQTTAEGLV